MASGALREQVHVRPEVVWRQLRRVTAPGALLSESAYVSTCARSELYGLSSDPARLEDRVLGDLAARYRVPEERLRDWTRLRVGGDAVRHLFRTASGLESAIQGEAQILGQVRRASVQATESGTAGPVLSRLFQDAVHVGRQVRCRTAIGRGTTSLAAAAVERLTRRWPDAGAVSVLVVGAGETGDLVARLLRSAGVGRLVVANRTLDRAEALARSLEGSAIPLRDVPRMAREVDVVFGAVTAPEPVLRAEHLAGSSRPRLLVDLSHPRAFAVEACDETEIVDLEALHRGVEAARDFRAREVPLAESIVTEHVEHFVAWLRGRAAVPVLNAMRRRVLDRALDEAERLSRGRSREDREELRRMARSLARALLHEPTVALRTADPGTPRGRHILEATSSLFGLDALASPSTLPTES